MNHHVLRPNQKGRWQRVVDQGNRGGLFNVALGNMTQYRVGLMVTKNGVFVAVEGKGAYEFCFYADWRYVSGKLNIEFEGDAQNLADFINCQLGVYRDEPQGDYNRHPDLCQEEWPT